MSKFVVNNEITMQWEKRCFVQTKGKVFLVACQEYETEKYGKITVAFDSYTAFLWGEDTGNVSDLWNTKEIVDFVRKEHTPSFPTAYENYIPLISEGDFEIDMEALYQYGLEEYADDIEERLNDLRVYGEESDTPVF